MEALAAFLIVSLLLVVIGSLTERPQGTTEAPPPEQ